MPEKNRLLPSSTDLPADFVSFALQAAGVGATEASEAKLSTILNATPTAIGLYVGEDMIVGLTNQAYIEGIGKGPDVLGKPLRTLMPEWKGQRNLKNVETVYRFGELTEQVGAPVDIVRDGIITHNYYDLTYSPLRDAAGRVYVVLSTGIDVTQEVKNRQRLEASEQHYRQLAESLAQQISRMKWWKVTSVSGRGRYPNALHVSL